ncbi:MAG: lysophospholipase [Chitinophagaceae bacterium]|nr:lysophospholipase [Chitinophagaceae bacterium]
MSIIQNEPLAKTYLALGDSYTIGQSVSSVDRFPNQTVFLLRGLHIKIDDPKIIATTGWTTKNLLDALLSTNLPTNYDVVSLLIGVNNQYQGRSIEEYKTEFTLLLDRAIQYANNRPTHVFVLSIPDYSVMPFANGLDKAKIAAEIDQFNAANKIISLQLGVNYLNITAISRENDPEFIGGDGLHPSGKEYYRWAQLLAPMMMPAFQ